MSTDMCSKSYYILLLVFIIVIEPNASQLVGTKVTTAIKQGTIVGFKDVTERGSYFNAFLGIPYAIPPVGDLRFKDPLPHQGWPQGEFIADKYGPPCPQWDTYTGNIIGDENCLTLNVFTPKMPDNYEVSHPMPVMFYIHGGAFIKGSSSLYGAAKLLDEPIVLVTINYRLGVLGFLSTEDEWGPGNYGFMDLILGLHWVHKNILVFNGDARRITIFGESAGAAAVSLLMMSPLAHGLFWLAITQSGSSLCDWAVEEQPYSYASTVASLMGCTIHSGFTIVDCLRMKSAEEIVRVQQSQFKFSYFPLRTAAVVDRNYRANPFLPDRPEVLMTNGNYSKVPLITGVVLNEGVLFALHILLQNAVEIGNNPHYFEDVVLPMTVRYISDQMYTAEKMAKIKSFYFRDVDFSNMEQVIPAFVDLLSDFLFFSGNDKTVKLHSRHAPVYSYVLTHRGNQSYAQPLIQDAYKINFRSQVLSNGVSHADDLLYLFNLPNMESMRLCPEDYQVQNVLTLLWTTYAHQGTPNRLSNGGPQQPALFWNNAKETEMVYLDITVYSKMGRDFRKFELSVFEFIDKTLPNPEPYIQDTQRPYYIATWVLLSLVALLIIGVIILMVFLVRAQHKRSYSTNELDAYG
ncbi:hypothetical protein CHUAL_008022 [Chamberlinius hualienensis]